MRELTQEEIVEVSGGDGLKLPGGGYISTTRGILNGLGVVGAASTAFSVGYTIGTGINYTLERNDISLGGWAYDKWGHGS